MDFIALLHIAQESEEEKKSYNIQYSSAGSSGY